MLVISRHKNEELILTTETGKVIRVVVVELRDGKARIGIDAPAEISVTRPDMRHRRPA